MNHATKGAALCLRVSVRMSPVMTFAHIFETEAAGDSTYLEISTDGGVIVFRRDVGR